MLSMNQTKVIGILTVIIIILLTLLFIQHNNLKNKPLAINNTSLLSPRIYAGILEPQSYLILNFEPLKKNLQKDIQIHNWTTSVYLVNLRNGASMGINSNRAYPPASLSKVPVAILMMKKVEEGILTLNSSIKIHQEDKQQSSGDLYLTNDDSVSLYYLLQLLLQNSDNTAFKVMLRYLKQNDNEFLADYWDFFSVDSVRAKGKENEMGLITPRSMYNVFSSLYLSTVLVPEHS